MKENLLLLTLSTIISLIILEFGLRALTPFPVNYKSSKIPDDILQYRIDPDFPEIDKNGFRNPPSSGPFEIVTIGDSHTFGYNVNSKGSWPRQLEKITGKPVYNFGIGSYDIFQYRILMQRAADLAPEHVLLGLYVTNDLIQACKKIQTMHYWSEWARTNKIDISRCPTHEKHSYEFEEPGFSFVLDTAIGSQLFQLKENHLNFRIYNILGMVGLNDKYLVVNEPINKTLIGYYGIEYRKENMDMSDPKVAFGINIFETFILQARDILDKKNITLSVMFIPSKQRAYHSYLKDNNYQLNQNYIDLVRNEEKLTAYLQNWFTQNGIPSIDANPYLEKALRYEDYVYPRNSNGHPLETGYRAYALAARDLIEKQLIK